MSFHWTSCGFHFVAVNCWERNKFNTCIQSAKRLNRPKNNAHRMSEERKKWKCKLWEHVQQINPIRISVGFKQRRKMLRKGPNLRNAEMKTSSTGISAKYETSIRNVAYEQGTVWKDMRGPCKIGEVFAVGRYLARSATLIGTLAVVMLEVFRELPSCSLVVCTRHLCIVWRLLLYDYDNLLEFLCSACR